jgi:hypothetical protein
VRKDHPNATSTARPFRPQGGACGAASRKSLEKREKWVWIYCKALKFLKTGKTFFGNPWRWNRTSLEMFGVGTAFIWKRLVRGLEPSGDARPSLGSWK